MVRAGDVLGLDSGRCVLVPNGFDPEAFRPWQVDHKAHWRRHLVDEPRGSIYGGEVAAPAFEKIASFALPYLKIPPQ